MWKERARGSVSASTLFLGIGKVWLEAGCFEVDDMLEALEGKGWGRGERGEGENPNYPKDLTNGLNIEVAYT